MLRATLLFLSVLNSTDALAANWLALGDLRGVFEPCGCDPSSDLGGIYRVGALVKQVQQFDRQSLIFLNGKNFSQDKKREKENNLIAESLSMLQITAALPTSFDDIALYSKAKIPMVLTNSQDPSIPRSKISSGACILGFSKFGLKISDGIFKDNIQNAALCGGLSSVFILTDFDDLDLARLGEFYKPTAILRASSRDAEVKPDGLEKKDPESLINSDLPFPNFKIPLGAAGVWVSEGLYRSISRLELFFGKKPVCPNNENDEFSGKVGGSLFSECKLREIPIIWLEKNYDDKPSLTEKLLEKNTFLQAQKFKKNLIVRLSERKESNFIGAKQCQKCHLEAFKIWQKSKHSNAIQVLIAAKKHQQYDCIGCHVVGFEEKGGYLDQKNTPHLASVGCENCHGPGKDHAANPGLNKTSGGRFICTECHVNGHSPNFDLVKYWGEIEHGKGLLTSEKNH